MDDTRLVAGVCMWTTDVGTNRSMPRANLVSRSAVDKLETSRSWRIESTVREEYVLPPTLVFEVRRPPECIRNCKST